MTNLLLLTDSYKITHSEQYPPKTTHVYSYFESRVGAKFDDTVFFGLQYYIKKYLTGRVVTEEKIQQAKEFAKAHLGTEKHFNEAGWRHILEKHDGHLPILIKAVPEGTVVPFNNVLMTIVNTDPSCFWLTNYLETLLSMVWYPSTVATLSREVKKVIADGLEKTGTPGLIGFKLHDFGFRGSTSVESAGIGGLAHLINFMGTDTIAAITTGMEYYDSGVCGFSIPASEHSTITSWGRDCEVDAFRNMLDKYPEGLVACVSDSYDIDKACSELWGSRLRDNVLKRNGTLVVRPDSGDIVATTLRVLDVLGSRFGSFINNQGFKVLDDHVRVIQGDGCSLDTITSVIKRMIENGWSVDNVAFGMGGGLLQKVHRDTQRFAFKCSEVVVDGVHQPVFKSPATDPTKKSKAGRMKLIKPFGGDYHTVDESYANPDIMQTVFENGKLLVDIKFADVRDRAKLVGAN